MMIRADIVIQFVSNLSYLGSIETIYQVNLTNAQTNLNAALL